MLLKGFTLFAAIHVSMACFLPDTGYLGEPRGANGVGKVEGIPTAYECQLACQNEPNCEFWVWNSPNWRARHFTCYFKRDDSGMQQGPMGRPSQMGRIAGPKVSSIIRKCLRYQVGLIFVFSMNMRVIICSFSLVL